jgi:hypothetical protein
MANENLDCPILIPYGDGDIVLFLLTMVDIIPPLLNQINN